MNAAIDPKYCACYSTTSNDGMIVPVLCRAHEDDLQRKLSGFGYSVPKYQRYFATEQDARDRAKIIYSKWPGEAYSTSCTIIPISRWFLLRAWWAASAD